jgi:hypothetical protein
MKLDKENSLLVNESISLFINQNLNESKISQLTKNSGENDFKE